MTEIDITNFELLKDIGPTARKEIKSGGYTTILELAAVNTEVLMEACDISNDKAKRYIKAANDYLRENNILQKSIITGLQDLERRESIKRITTGSNDLNRLLGGGIETSAITEFYAEFGSGKTQICFSTAINSMLPEDQGGIDNPSVIYIDTEDTFRPERIKSICEARELDWKNILGKFNVIKPYNLADYILHINNLNEVITEYKPKVLVIDSIISYFRPEMSGRGKLAERQQLLNKVLHYIGRYTKTYELATIITNQVQDNPDIVYGRKQFKPVGGNILAHFSTYRLSIQKSGEKRTATMQDSPNTAYDSAEFTISEKGIEDFVDKKKKKAIEQETTEYEE